MIELTTVRKRIETSISGRAFSEIDRAGAPKESNILVFGCGYDGLPSLIATYFHDAKVIGYDIDPEKIRLQHLRGAHAELHRRIDYVSDKPDSLFDIVIANAVLHENPDFLAKEAASFAKEQGMIGIIDYDMKHMPAEIFAAAWGRNMAEKREMGIMGFERCHAMHTSFSLEDCRRLMNRNGIRELFGKGELSAASYGILAPPKNTTRHFIYIGRKC